MIVFILQMGKLRHKNEHFAQCHIASKWLSKDLKTEILKNFAQECTYYLFNKYLTSTTTF